MMSAKYVLALVFVAIASAVPRPDAPQQQYGPPSYRPPSPSYEPGMPYEFSYAVKDDYSGNDFGHDETSDGQLTSGSYRVVLPDGRTQMVKFNSDSYNGYIADVTYEGEATYPAPAPAYRPPPAPYHPPAPAYPPPPAPYHPPTPAYPPPPAPYHPPAPAYPPPPAPYHPPTPAYPPPPAPYHPPTPAYPPPPPSYHAPEPEPGYPSPPPPSMYA